MKWSCRVSQSLVLPFRMAAEAAKAPHQTAPGVRYASGPASRADLAAGQRVQVKCLVNVHVNQPLTPPLRRIGRQQSVRWGEGRRARTTAGPEGAGRGRGACCRERRIGVPRAESCHVWPPARLIGADSNGDSNSSQPLSAATFSSA